MAEPGSEAALPDGSILFHIGPHKTGTTTLQAALAENRARLRRQGVVYPGDMRHEMGAAMAAAVGQVDAGKSLEAATARFHRLMRELRESDARLGILSSEFYSDAPQERIPSLLEEIGPTAQVVVTLRPIARILASQWQQYLQNRMTYSFDEWLRAILDDPVPGEVTPSFWRRHRHDLLVRRWLDVVGPERLTIVVIDERDHGFLLRSFEQLLGVEAGTLVPSDLRSNRSLTWEEIELMRAFNARFREAGLGVADYTRFVRFGAAREIQLRPPVGERILTPQWAIDRIGELGAGMAEQIASYGVRVIGSLDHLSDPALAPAAGENAPVEDVDVELAASLAAGLATHLGRVAGRVNPDRSPGPIEAATAALHRAGNVGIGLANPDGLRAELAAVEAQIAELRRSEGTSRRSALRELLRRARRRVRQRVRWR